MGKGWERPKFIINKWWSHCFPLNIHHNVSFLRKKNDTHANWNVLHSNLKSWDKRKPKKKRWLAWRCRPVNWKLFVRLNFVHSGFAKLCRIILQSTMLFIFCHYPDIALKCNVIIDNKSEVLYSLSVLFALCCEKATYHKVHLRLFWAKQTPHFIRFYYGGGHIKEWNTGLNTLIFLIIKNENIKTNLFISTNDIDQIKNLKYTSINVTHSVILWVRWKNEFLYTVRSIKSPQTSVGILAFSTSTKQADYRLKNTSSRRH